LALAALALVVFGAYDSYPIDVSLFGLNIQNVQFKQGYFHSSQTAV